MIPEGKYQAYAIEATIPDAEEGKEHVKIKFALLCRTEDGIPLSADRQQTIDWRGWFSEKARKFTIAAMRRCGWRGDDIGNLSSMLHGCGGQEVQLEIEHEEFNGKIYSKVKWINPRDGRKDGSPMPEDKRAAFAAKMRGDVVKLTRDDPDCRDTDEPLPKPQEEIPF